MQNNFHIYKSSAGSGKTYTLVKEYLKIVLRHPTKTRNILAITFTNAAAAEMKERIIGELGNIGGLQGKDAGQIRGHSLANQILNELEAEYGVSPAPEHLVANAGLVLKNILHNYADFSVSTIDSFVHRVIRTFSFDLFLPFHFDVELDAEVLLDQATDILISRAGRDRHLTRLLVAFIISQADDGKDLRIEKLISSLGATLMEEDAGEPVKRLKGLSLEDFFRISQKIREKIRGFEQEVAGRAGEALEMIHRHGLGAEHFSRKGSGIYGYFSKLAAGPVRQYITPNSYVMKTLEEDKWTSSATGGSEKRAIESIKGDLRDLFYLIAGPDLSGISDYKTCLALGKYFFQVAVLNELDRVLQEVKSDNVLLHISDFNKMVAAIVAEQPVPFIYERLGERYQHYMIDEFQDTSGLQWQNLLPLVDNSLAGGHLSLVVGDGKQAIYRFRNGDVEQFACLPALTDAIRSVARPEWEQSLRSNYLPKHLGTNYRSREEIVTFNNRLFAFAAGFLPENLQTIYEDAGQQALKTKAGGTVEVRFLDPAAQQGGSPDAGGDPAGEAATTDYDTLTLDAVTAAIERAMNDGHPFQDITILCHSNAKASMVARHLLQKGMPVISSESLLLSQSDEVIFILAFIRLLANQYDQVAATEILGYLIRYNRITTPHSLHECLQGIRKHNDAGDGRLPMIQPLDELFRQNHIPASFHDFFHLNLYDICEHIIRIFFAGQGTPNPFVAFFSDAVYDYTERNTASVVDFLAWWEEKGQTCSLVLPDGVDAVRIMTIHKSKGLQFPVVMVPFADHSFFRTTKRGKWVDVQLGDIPELPTTWVGMSSGDLGGTPYEAELLTEQGKSHLDTLNMVYVAFTRPIDKLFIFSKKTKKTNRLSTGQLLQSFLQQEGLWDEERLVYSFGMAEGLHASASGRPPAKKDIAADGQPGHAAMPPVTFETIVSQPWSRVLRMRSHQAERSMIAGGEEFLERGNLLHRVMENITTPADVSRVLRQLVETGEMDRADMTEWEEKISRLIGREEVSTYFATGLKVKKEAGIYDSNGDYYRPDRIVIGEDETVVMDYKTGKQYAKHQQQMERYADLLSRMGYRNIKKLILYLDTDTIKTV